MTRLHTMAAAALATLTAAAPNDAQAGISYADHFSEQYDGFHYDYDTAWDIAAHGAWWDAKQVCKRLGRDTEFIRYNTSETWTDGVWSGWTVWVEVEYRCI